MIIQETDHPLVLFGEFEVCLPQVVTIWALESTFTPNFPWSFNPIVQLSLDEDSMDSVMANSDYAFATVVLLGSLQSCMDPSFSLCVASESTQRMLPASSSKCEASLI